MNGGENIAVTLLLQEQPGRLDIVRTVVSHGWLINLTVQDDGHKVYDRIPSAKIFTYLIRANFDTNQLMVAYQPEINHLTIIGNNEEIEKQYKGKIVTILEKKKKGQLFYNNKDDYVQKEHHNEE